MPKDFKEHSRTGYFNKDNSQPTTEQLNLGCMQRIANATELMATNFLKLQQDNEYLRNRNKSLISSNEFLARQSASYKGKFNRLKKSIANKQDK